MTEAASIETLTDQNEQLLRQVHPALIPNGEMTSTAFMPSATDDDHLSTLRERVGAEEAFRRWTDDLGYDSAGTWAVSVGEAKAVDLQCVDDGSLPGLPPDHASVVFADLPTKGKKKQAARKLRDDACRRGCLHANTV